MLNERLHCVTEAGGTMASLDLTSNIWLSAKLSAGCCPCLFWYKDTQQFSQEFVGLFTVRTPAVNERLFHVSSVFTQSGRLCSFLAVEY